MLRHNHFSGLEAGPGRTLSVLSVVLAPVRRLGLSTVASMGASMTDKTGWTEPRAASMGIAWGPLCGTKGELPVRWIDGVSANGLNGIGGAIEP